MKNVYEMFPGSEGAAPAAASSARPPKGYELLPGGAPAGAASKGGCGTGGCGCASKRTGGAKASAPPMAAHLRTVLEETRRALQSMPGADPSGSMGRVFQALETMTDDLLQQVDSLPRR